MYDDHRETEFHDHAASQAVDRLLAQWDPQNDPVSGDADQAIRQHLASLAALAYDLEPEVPSVALKERLMASLGAAARPAPVAQPAPAHVAVPDRSPVDRTLQHETASALERQPGDQTLAMGTSPEPDLVGSGTAHVIPMRRTARSTSWVPLSLAAALAFCLIGLGYLYGQVTTQDQLLTNQSQRLALLDGVTSELAEAHSEVAALHDQLAMVNTVAREAYPLHTVSNAQNLGNAQNADLRGDEATPRGRVYVCGQHQQWYLTVSGLEPAPQEQEYHLWFMTKDGPVDAGVVEVKGGAAGLRDLTMPENTSGFSLTLESSDAGDVPRGKTVLIGDTPVKL